MKTLKPHAPNKWGIHTERKALIGEFNCNNPKIVQKIQDGLMTDELRKLKGQRNETNN